jgi:hypothetical protein
MRMSAGKRFIKSVVRKRNGWQANALNGSGSTRARRAQGVYTPKN